MASQLVATSGNRKLRRNQIAELEAKMGSLAEIQRQKTQKEMHRDTMRFKNKEFKQQKKQAKKTLAFEEEVSRREMGVEAAKFGFNVATSGSGATLGQIGSKIKSGLSGMTDATAPTSNIYSNVSTLPTSGRGISSPSIGRGGWKPGGPGDTPAIAGAVGGTASGGVGSKIGGFFGNLSPTRMLGAGLAGFGASRMVKGKGKRMLLGAGVGGLMSLFGGGGLGGSIAGGLFGGLGGMI
jgi:hypothetical protein